MYAVDWTAPARAVDIIDMGDGVVTVKLIEVVVVVVLVVVAAVVCVESVDNECGLPPPEPLVVVLDWTES